jgi:hypothetical protein
MVSRVRHKAGALVPITVSRWMEVKIVAGAKPYPRISREGSVSNAVAPKRQTSRQELRHRLHVTNNNMYKGEDA